MNKPQAKFELLAAISAALSPGLNDGMQEQRQRFRRSFQARNYNQPLGRTETKSFLRRKARLARTARQVNRTKMR